MAVERASLYGTSNIGVFVVATNEYALVPRDVPPKFVESISQTLGIDHEHVIRCSIDGSRIIGALVAGNSRGLLLPKTIMPSEALVLKKALGAEIAVDVLPTKYTALGNLILVNDRAALVFRNFEKRVIQRLADVLDVEVSVGRIADIDVVGSAAAVNNKGLMLPPQASANEIKSLSNYFKVQVADVGTINRGKPFIRAGLVVNDKGALAGDETTGPELVHIEQIFGLTGV